MNRARAAATVICKHLRLGPITPGARRGLAYILILAFLLTGGAYWQSSRSVNTLASQQHALIRQQQALARQQLVLTRQQQAQCKFDADLGGAPVVAPKGLKPSLLGVTIVSDARVAWHGNRCPGHLPAAQPSFLRWARHYHLPYQ